MKSILYELYRGNLDPCAYHEPQLKEHKNLIKRKFNQYDWLGEELEKINPRLKSAFDQMTNIPIMEASWDTANAFANGFALGVKIMAEVYNMDLSANED